MKTFAKEFHSNHLGNCAMAVSAAWANQHGLEPSEVEKFKNCGAGHAKDGLCGAIYTAIHYRPDKKEELLAEFQKKCGGILCKEIRPDKKQTCTERVAIAAELLDNLEKNG